MSETEFNLEHVRYVKRLIKRTLKQIVLMERYLKKGARERKASAEEIAAAHEAYRPPLDPGEGDC